MHLPVGSEARDELCRDDVAPDVHRGADHIKQSVDTNDDAHCCNWNGRKSAARETRVDGGDHDDKRDQSRRRNSRGADRRERRSQDHDYRVAKSKIDAKELEEEE